MSSQKKIRTANEVTAAARAMLRQAVCPECAKKGYEDSEECAWCDERVEFTATELLRDFESERAAQPSSNERVRDWRAGCECNRSGLCFRCQAADEIERRRVNAEEWKAEFYKKAEESRSHADAAMSLRSELDALRAAAEPATALQKRAEYAERFHAALQLAVTHLGKFAPVDFKDQRKGEYVAAVYSAAESALNGAGEIPELIRPAQPPEAFRLWPIEREKLIDAHEWWAIAAVQSDDFNGQRKHQMRAEELRRAELTKAAERVHQERCSWFKGYRCDCTAQGE